MIKFMADFCPTEGLLSQHKCFLNNFEIFSSLLIERSYIIELFFSLFLQLFVQKHHIFKSEIPDWQYLQQ